MWFGTNPANGEPLPIATDQPHQLKRYRTQSNNDKFEFIEQARFVEISTKHPTVLPPSVVSTTYQVQSVPVATRKFSKPVEDKAREMKFEAEANFIRVIRLWTAAFDERGLTLTQRLQYIKDMDKFLLSLIDLNDISQACAPYIKGISQELFEETLVLNHLFRHVLSNLPEEAQAEFNSRSLSTDTVECLFSVLKRVCPCPTVRLLLQAWRTTSRELRKQLDENRGYES